MALNFAVIGVAGFVAPRHLRAIRDTGNNLVAATDPHDAAGVLDQYSLDVRFFPEIERFDRHLEKLRHRPESERVHYVSVCSPNYLHDAHTRLGLRVGADVICEKPLVINPWNLDQLADLERETGKRVHTVLQLRAHEALLALKARLDAQPPGPKKDVELTYITGRGRWYQVSWKGNPERSGGLATNIGIHFFDLLSWLFGKVERSDVHLRENDRMGGVMELERARVKWLLSVNSQDLPFAPAPGKRLTHRSLTVDGSEVEFSEGFGDLHTKVYQETLAGRGWGIEDARPSIELVHRLRTQPLAPSGSSGAAEPHPLVKKLLGG